MLPAQILMKHSGCSTDWVWSGTNPTLVFSRRNQRIKHTHPLLFRLILSWEMVETDHNAIGNNNGLKIRSGVIRVWVRIPSSAASKTRFHEGKSLDPRFYWSRTVAHENARKARLFVKYSSRTL